MDRDIKRLWLLSASCYVTAGLAAIAVYLPVRLLFFGAGLMSVPSMRTGDMDKVVGVIFVLAACPIVAALLVAAIGAVLLGRNLARRRRYANCFSLVVLMSVFMPVGTILAVATLIVLRRPSIKLLFEDVTRSSS
jgi:hypothetical protein